MPALPPDRPGATTPASGTQAEPPRSGREGAHPHRRRPPRPAGESHPLPDPAAVRLYLIPDSAPPYDRDATTAREVGTVPVPGANPDHGTARSATGAAGSGPWGVTPGTASGTGAPAVEPGSAAGSWEPGTGDGHRPPHPGPPGPDPAMHPCWPSRFAQVLAETLAGSRPPRQMVPWTTERARSSIQRLGPQLSAGERPRVRRVVTFRPASDVVEMTVVVGFGSRVRALAVRLERAGPLPATPGRKAQAARWLCTAVEAA